MARTSRVATETKMNVVAVTGARITCPAFLDKEERAEWDEIVGSLGADYFRPADAPLLAAFCVASAIFKQCRLLLKTDGVIWEDERGNARKHPAADLMSQQSSAMSNLAVKLRLCPSSRYSEKQANTKHGKSAKSARPWDTAEEAA